MADSTTWLLVGMGVGLGVGIGVTLLMRQRRLTDRGDGVTSVRFHRDEHDRIAGFERVGVGSGVAIDAPR